MSDCSHGLLMKTPEGSRLCAARALLIRLICGIYSRRRVRGCATTIRVNRSKVSREDSSCARSPRTDYCAREGKRSFEAE